MLSSKLFIKVFAPKYSKFYYRNTFWDSYFDHGCMIVLEEDVLYTDIEERHPCACLLRWWHDLFLLSYNSNKARYFYLSSFAIKTERAKQFRSYKKIIHPLCRFRLIWSSVIFICAIFSTFGLSLTTSVIYGDWAKKLRGLNIICELMFFFDILINFKTGYVDQTTKTIVLDQRAISLHYMSTKIGLHVASAIPFQTLLLLVPDTDDNSSMIIAVFRLLSLLRVIRIVELTRYWSNYEKVGPSNYTWQVLRMSLLGFIVMHKVLHISDTVTLIESITKGYLHKDAFLSYMLIQKHIVKRSMLELYWLDMARLFKAFMLSSPGLYLKHRPIDRIISLCVYFLGALFFMWGLLEAITYFYQYDYAVNEKAIALDRTKCMMRARQLSDVLKSRITDYYSYHAIDALFPQRKNQMYSMLPEAIRNEINITLHRYLLANVPYFSKWPPSLIDELALLLKVEIYLSGDVVATAWTPGECLVIVETGVLAVYTIHDVETGHLIDGDYFGELSLVTDKELRMSTVCAVTNCCLLALYKSTFRNLMRQHPNLFFNLKKKLRNKYHKARESSASALSG